MSWRRRSFGMMMRYRGCRCRTHPLWLALDLVVWLLFDRGILVRRTCPIHGCGRSAVSGEPQ